MRRGKNSCALPGVLPGSGALHAAVCSRMLRTTAALYPAILPIPRPARPFISAGEEPGARFCACLPTSCQVENGATPTEGGRGEEEEERERRRTGEEGS